MLGCADILGQNVNWAPLLNRQCGALRAMDMLQLELLALPGARLAPEKQLPRSSGFVLSGRGGSAYASTAWLWRSHLDDAVLPRMDIGSDRRFWLTFTLCLDHPLHLACIYLPPFTKDGRHEQEWQLELIGLESDVQLLLGTDSAAKLLMVGDWNVQPPSISGVPDRCPTRASLLEAFQARWAFSSLNPSLQPYITEHVPLPLRGSTVCIHPGSTRHDNSSIGRAIDLGIGSANLAASMHVHNGIDCKNDLSCDWQMCVEYCLGDHFLQHFHVWVYTDPSKSLFKPSVPAAWHDPGRWKQGFTMAISLCDNLSQFCSRIHENSPALLTSKLLDFTIKRELQHWIADSMAWCQSVLASIVRDTFVHPRRAPTCIARFNDILCEEQTAIPVTDPSIVLLCNGLRVAHERGEIKPSLALNVYRFLRSAKPSPKAQMIIDDRLASTEETNQGWLAQLSALKHDDVHMGSSLLQARQLRAQYLAKSLHFIGRGTWDEPVIELEVTSCIQNWKQSCATTADLLPRSCFVCGSSAWVKLIWNMVKITGPGCLACRPVLWREACLDALFKSGPSALQSSYRLLTVRVQMGLLQEGVMSARLTPNIRAYLTIGQSGYARDVEDVMLVLFEFLSAQVQLFNRCPWICFGDFRKAFPYTDRADLLCLLYSGALESRRHDSVKTACTKSASSETKKNATKPQDNARASPSEAIGDERTPRPICKRRSLRGSKCSSGGARARRSVPGPTFAPPGRPLCPVGSGEVGSPDLPCLRERGGARAS